MKASEWSRRKKELEARMVRYEKALSEISNGDGAYGAQAFKFKNIARRALGIKEI